MVAVFWAAAHKGRPLLLHAALCIHFGDCRCATHHLRHTIEQFTLTRASIMLPYVCSMYTHSLALILHAQTRTKTDDDEDDVGDRSVWMSMLDGGGGGGGGDVETRREHKQARAASYEPDMFLTQSVSCASAYESAPVHLRLWHTCVLNGYTRTCYMCMYIY